MNHLFESELEPQFIGASERLSTKELPVRIDKQLVNNKEGYVLQVGDCLWEIEPQVWLDETEGVMVRTRADLS